MTTLDCAQFEHRGSFADYVLLIESRTNNNISLAEPCSPQICQVLWGTGNPDISGIGMIIGYIIENILGIVLAVLCTIANSERGGILSRHGDLVTRIFDSFYEYCLFFCFSTELACAIMVTKVTFGLNADGMGNLTLRITWATATLTIIPLVYRLLIWNWTDPTRFSAVNNPRSGPLGFRRKLTFPLFCVCWVISLYTFLDKMADTFSPSQIGDKATNPNAVISYTTWAEIQDLCAGNWETLTPTENVAIDAFDIAASLLVALIALGKLLYGVINSFGVKIPFLTQRKHPVLVSTQKVLSLILLVIFPLLAIGLIWSIYRLSDLQNDLAKSIGEVDSDNEWTFGQIVAVTVFTPVLVELVCEIGSRWSESRQRSAV